MSEQKLPSRLAARDAAPDLPEVIALLQLEGARRVVRDHHRESPHPLAICFRAEWRRAFAQPAETSKVVFGVKHVMKARLPADIDPPPHRLLDEVRTPRRAHVHDMQAAARFTSHADGRCDGGDLGLRRPRVQKIARGRTLRFAQERGIFGMHQQD